MFTAKEIQVVLSNQQCVKRDGSRISHMGERQSFIRLHFFRKLYENEEIWTERDGRVSKIYCVDPSLVKTKFLISTLFYESYNQYSL